MTFGFVVKVTTAFTFLPSSEGGVGGFGLVPFGVVALMYKWEL